MALIDCPTLQDSTNQLWEQMKGLRFQLRESVSVTVLEYRDCTSYLLRNVFDQKQFRLSKGVFELLEIMDGQRTLEQICEPSLSTNCLSSTKKHEILTALTQLQAEGLLSSDVPRALDSLVEQQQLQRRRHRLAGWMRLLSPRFALWDPERFLARSFPWIAWLFQPMFFFIWLGVIVYAGSQALMHSSALIIYGAQRFDDPRQWLIMICAYPLIKGLHEMGHCYATKAGGGAISEMGITLLVLLPVPYVDASAASMFADKYQRILVSAAGIMVELFLASLALFFWLNSNEGVPRDAAFAVMLLGGISTLLFNGNPLLRFDGYYILTDAIGIPNLSTRASRYYAYVFKRYLLRVPNEKSRSTTPRECRWFVFYGAAATLYRISISLGIALFLIVTIPVLGMLMATWLLAIQLLWPLGRQLHYLLFSESLSGRRILILGTISGVLSTIFGTLALASFPSSSVVDGVVLLPKEAVVRANVEGFLEKQKATDHEPVKRGEILFVLSNPELKADIAVLEARVREIQARRDLLGFNEQVLREIHGERLAQAQADLAQLRQRESELTVRSPSAGTLQVPLGSSRIGRFIHQGDMLGYLADRNGIVIRVVAAQKDAGRIREDNSDITVHLADRTSSVLTGRLLGEVPLASERLPSAALGSQSGGAIQVDARDELGVTALEGVFAFDVAIPFDARGQFAGSRASVRFQHPSSPLLQRWYYSLLQLLRKQISMN